MPELPRLTTLAGCVTCAAALSACAAASGRAAAPPTTRAPSTTTSTAPAPGTAGLSFLTAWGSTLALWNANHTVDPEVPGQYWPRLPDDLDSYTALQLQHGRVVGYVLNLDPAMTLADAQARVVSELPLDAQPGPARSLAGCQQVIESGPTIAAVSGGGRVVVDFESNGNTFAPDAVTRIELSSLAPGASAPASCLPAGPRP